MTMNTTPISLPKGTTKVIIDPADGNMFVTFFVNGQGEAHSRELIAGTNIDGIVNWLTDNGFVCRIHRNGSAKCLRDKPTRIDFENLGNGWMCRKYPNGWTTMTPASEIKPMTDEQAAAAIKWCKDNGWTVREFPGGARAFKGEVKPVRDAGAILRMRRAIQNNSHAITNGEIDPRTRYDLAYDCF